MSTTIFVRFAQYKDGKDVFMNWGLIPNSFSKYFTEEIKDHLTNRPYDRFEFCLVDNLVYMSKLDQLAGSFIPENWEDVNGRHAYIPDFDETKGYDGDSIVLGPSNTLFYCADAVAAGPFDIAEWQDLAAGVEIQTASCYMDPTTELEETTVIIAKTTAMKPASEENSDEPSLCYAKYDPRDISTLWKDEDRTDPVTAAGDLVKVMDDVTGRGNHATCNFFAEYQEDDNGLGYINTNQYNHFVPKSLPEKFSVVYEMCGLGKTVLNETEDKFILGRPGQERAEADTSIGTTYVVPYGEQDKVTDLKAKDYVKSNINAYLGYFMSGDCKDIDISGWDFSIVKDTSYFFQGNDTFNKDVSGWNTQSVDSTQYMFKGASAFNNGGRPLLSRPNGWSMESVTLATGMFDNATSFNAVVSNWDIKKLRDADEMFQGAIAFNQDLSKWSPDALVEMDNMFEGAAEFNSDLSSWCLSNVTETPMDWSKDAPINGQVAKYPQWFGCLNGVDRNMEAYYNVNVVSSVRIEKLDPTVPQIGDEVRWVGDLTGNGNHAVWKSGPKPVLRADSNGKRYLELQYQTIMEANIPIAVDAIVGHVKRGVSHHDVADIVTSGKSGYEAGMKSGRTGKVWHWCEEAVMAKDKPVAEYNAVRASMLANAQDFEDAAASPMAFMFKDDNSFAGGVDEFWLRNVNSLEETFMGVTRGVLGVANWDTEDVTNFKSTFEDCTNMTDDLSGWLVDSPTTFENMFKGAAKFNSDLDQWDVGNVTTMKNMFQGCTLFNGDLSAWDVRDVTDMTGMFDGASAFNSDISAWNPEELTVADRILTGATIFNQDLSGWCLEKHPVEPTEWSTGSGIEADDAKHPGWNGCTSFDGYEAVYCIHRDGGIFEDVNGTIPAVSHNAPVRFMTDFSGNGNHAIFNSAGGAPELQVFSGTQERAVKFTGDDHLEVAGITANTYNSIAMPYSGEIFYDGQVNTGGARVGPKGLSASDGRVFLFSGEAIALTEPTADQKAQINAFYGKFFTGATANVSSFGENLFKDQTYLVALNPAWKIKSSRNGKRMFMNCVNFNSDLGAHDFSDLYFGDSMFEGATSFNIDLSTYNPIYLQEAPRIFFGATAFSSDLSGWDWNTVTVNTDAFTGSGIDGDTAKYPANY